MTQPLGVPRSRRRPPGEHGGAAWLCAAKRPASRDIARRSSAAWRDERQPSCVRRRGGSATSPPAAPAGRRPPRRAGGLPLRRSTNGLMGGGDLQGLASARRLPLQHGGRRGRTRPGGGRPGSPLRPRHAGAKRGRADPDTDDPRWTQSPTSWTAKRDCPPCGRPRRRRGCRRAQDLAGGAARSSGAAAAPQSSWCRQVQQRAQASASAGRSGRPHPSESAGAGWGAAPPPAAASASARSRGIPRPLHVVEQDRTGRWRARPGRSVRGGRALRAVCRELPGTMRSVRPVHSEGSFTLRPRSRTSVRRRISGRVRPAQRRWRAIIRGSPSSAPGLGP